MRLLFTIISMTVFLSACSFTSNNPEAYTAFQPLQVRVELPDSISEGGKQTIYASVSQGEEEITDAELVRFEVWSNNHEQHEYVTATAEGNGIYAVEVDFNQEGLYFAKAFTQVGDLYAMPTKRFAVGKITPEEAEYLLNGSSQPFSNDHAHH
ncbi:hypothetical protein JCM19047_2980 [Bacillus sp. JCM 19047]|nr:hypothetical protein JCM19047_2980 [Bacillus sp. JCM 19047]